MNKVMSFIKKPWVLFAIGVVLGGTILAGTVAVIVGKVKGIAHKSADPAASKAQGA